VSEKNARKTVSNIIIVEGKYDKNAVSQVVDALIIDVGGFRVYRDGDTRATLRRLAETRGAVILTDSDGAGFRIRARLGDALAGCDVKHAYVPEVAGRERRKTAASKSGLLGVEGMPPDVILGALVRAGATFAAPEQPPEHKYAPPKTEIAANTPPITTADLYAWGLSGTQNARSRRERLLRALGLPRLLGTSSLIRVLNTGYSRAEIERMVADIDVDTERKAGTEFPPSPRDMFSE
jgi:ribonuclease M5